MQKHNYTDTLQLQGRLILAIDSFVTKHGKASLVGTKYKKVEAI